MNTTKLLDSNDIQVHQWNENVFLNRQKEWQTLLENSESDQLFLSWFWISNWWLIWGNASTDRITIYALYLKQELIGLLPLYLSEDSYFRGLISTKRLQFLGTRFKGSCGIRPEYLGAIVKKGYADAATRVLLDEVLKNTDWDEFIVSDIDVTGALSALIKSGMSQNNLLSRIISSDYAFSVNTTGNFEHYLHNLGKNSRLKLFNRRKVLEKYGEVVIENINLCSNTEIFELVNYFHKERYNSTSYSDKHIEIIRKTLAAYPENQHLHCSSILKVDGKKLSAMINIFINDKIYNINFGYLENFDKKISLGTLHLGYMLEKAFSSENIKTFDFLAGTGKNSNYKSHLAEMHATLETIQIIRNPFLKFLYFVNDKYYRKIKRFLKS